jgi:tRNA A-37 threonylcarbamoyl transferase component Bud32/tetratricopeptide (TPR) repeat protein
MEIDSGRWRRIEELFHTALAQDEASRNAFLETACAGDDELRQELESLLAREHTAAGFLETLALHIAAQTMADAPGRSLLGRQIGHYQLLSRLGAGGMAEVYLAEDVRLRRQVALKFFAANPLVGSTYARRYLREARAASALSHPNIVTVYDIGDSEVGCFIAMELVPGSNLRTLIAKRPTVDEAARVVAQVARALASAHAADIIHRDIKPENIMLRDDGYVKVVDFGLARAPHLSPQDAKSASALGLTISGAGVVAGTVSYMSPEQSVGDPLTAATDVYSLGVVLYELLTGRLPIVADSKLGHIAALASQHVIAPSHQIPEIPAALDDLVLQTLDRSAARRPSAQEVALRLEALAQPAVAGQTRIAAAQRVGVGREAERRALHAAFAGVGKGASRMLLVAGEAGVGKTTLVDDFLADVVANDARALIARGRCSERLAGTGAYLPILEAVHNYMAHSGDTAAARLVKTLAPNWYDQIVSATGTLPAGVTATVPAERMKREIVAWLQEVGRERPFVLFLDDLHWVDASTVDVLAYLLDRPDELRVLVLGTYRPTEIGLQHSFADLRLDATTRGVCDEVPLGALERADIDQYLAQAFPGHGLRSEFGAFVHRRTEGHALFMVDLLRYLKDRGAIAQRNDVWVLTEPLTAIEDAVPQSVRSMVDRKLEQLSEDDRRLLVIASVQGDEFDVAVVAAAAGHDAAAVEEQLERLERLRGVVRLTGEEELPDGTLTARYRFVHVLYQNDLYGSLRPARRAGLSLTVAETLKRFYRLHTDRIAAQLALLFEAARDFDKAAEHFLTASERAQRMGAMHEAEALAQRGVGGLSNLPETPERDRRELSLQVALAVPAVALHTHGAPETLAVFGRIQELGRRSGKAHPLFAMLDQRAWAGISAGDTWNARDAALNCLAMAEEAADPAARIVAHFLLAVTSAQLAELLAACEHHEQIAKLYDPQIHHVSLAYIFASDLGIQSRSEHADLLFHMGSFARALALAEQAVMMGREQGPPLTLSIVLLRRLKIAMECGSLEEAKRLLAELEALWAKHQLMHRHWGPYYQGWILALSGDPDRGTVEMQRGIAGLRALGFRYYGPTMSAVIADLWLGTGRTEDARVLVDGALTEARTIGELHIVPELLRLRGALLWKAPATHDSTTRDGESAVREALVLARQHGSQYWELRAVNTLAARLVEQERSAEAVPLVEEILTRFRLEPYTDLPELVEARALVARIAKSSALGDPTAHSS